MDDDLWWVWFNVRRERLMARHTASLDLLATLMMWTQDAWVRSTEMQERACVLLDDVASSADTYRATAVPVLIAVPVSVGS